MIPVIAIIGRQNVGKSTLFNRVTRTRDALVANFPGLTRDRKYGLATWEGHEFIVVDTGGFDDEGEEGVEEGVKASIAVQSRVAIEESDLVLFVVDSQSGLMAMDLSIAEYLRKCEKNTIIVANKTDGIDINSADSAVSDFYSLGMGKVLPISASHGHGINSLLQKILPLVNYGLPKASFKSEFKSENNTLPIKIAIVGRPNVGKSTLTNSFIGEERVIVFDIPDTTRDSIYIPLERGGRKYVIIDTAGVLKKNKVTESVKNFSIIKTLQSIEDANVVLMVINSGDGLVAQDLSLLGFILNSGRAMVIAVNKWDVLSSEARNKIKEVLNIRLKFINFTRVHFISAVNLKKNKINQLFESVNEAYQCATKRINTAKLTRILHMAVDKYQPPLIRGHRAKPKYAHIGGYNPLLVVLHGTQLKDLPDAYKRYLINYFRRSLNIIGTPIHIQLKEGTNPFSGRRNMLTQTQFRKRKRLLSHCRKK